MRWATAPSRRRPAEMDEELQVNVSPGRLSVEAGGVAEVDLHLHNRSGIVDEFTVEVLGEAAAWATVSQPHVSIFPDAAATVQVSLRPPRSSHPPAGTIPVGFRVASTVEPGRSVVEECRVEIKPFVEIGGEVIPRRATGRFSAGHRLRVTNRGNAEANVSVRADVQDGDCRVSVPERPLLVPAGQRTTARIRVRPTTVQWQGSDEVHQYRLSLEPQG